MDRGSWYGYSSVQRFFSTQMAPSASVGLVCTNNHATARPNRTDASPPCHCAPCLTAPGDLRSSGFHAQHCARVYLYADRGECRRACRRIEPVRRWTDAPHTVRRSTTLPRANTDTKWQAAWLAGCTRASAVKPIARLLGPSATPRNHIRAALAEAHWLLWC